MAVDADAVRRFVRTFGERVAEHKDELTRLDSAIGDADHGINMDRGMKAAVAKLDGDEGEDVGGLLKTVGMTLVSTVGGAGGPLYGTLFLQLGTATAGKAELGPDDWADALDAAVAGVQMRGQGRARRQDDDRRARARRGTPSGRRSPTARRSRTRSRARRTRPRKGCARRCRSSRGRAAPAISASAARATRTPAPRRRTCSCGRRLTSGPD